MSIMAKAGCRNLGLFHRHAGVTHRFGIGLLCCAHYLTARHGAMAIPLIRVWPLVLPVAGSGGGNWGNAGLRFPRQNKAVENFLPGTARCGISLALTSITCGAAGAAGGR